MTKWGKKHRLIDIFVIYGGMEYILPTGTVISFYMHTKSIRI
jgi:hypothetical protein